MSNPGNVSWTGLLGYSGLPLSTFAVGWIYERRRYAHFGKSFLSMSIGLALLIILPIIIASLASPSASSSATSVDATIAGYLFTIWCLGILLVFPLALITAGLEALMHTLVRRVRGASRAD